MPSGQEESGILSSLATSHWPLATDLVLSYQLGDAHLSSLNHFRVDCDLAEFVHHDRDLRRARCEDMAEQRSFAAAERASDQSDGSARLHVKNDE